MSKINLGDKVRVISNISNHQFYIGEVVKLTVLEKDGIHRFDGEDGEWWYMRECEYEPVSKLKVGDSVKILSVKYPIEVFGVNIGDIVKILEMNEGIIRFKNNNGNYQLASTRQVELVENDKTEEFKVLEKGTIHKVIGYTIITGIHFGSSKTYSWLCDRELFDEIELNDLALVGTKLGEQIVQVIGKKEVLNKGKIHKKVIKKVNIS